MTISIQYLEHRDGRVFEVGKLWPGDALIEDPDKQHLQLAVGPMFLLPETSETVEYENEDGEDDEDGDGEIITRPATYEIWCVNNAMYLAWFGGFKEMRGLQVDRAALIVKMRGTTTRRYVVHADQVVGYYEEWPTVVAYEAMMDRMSQSDPDPAQPQPPNGAARAQV
jgi:hypothetical protein